MTKLIDPKFMAIGFAALVLLAAGAVRSPAVAGMVIFVRAKPHLNAAAAEMTVRGSGRDLGRAAKVVNKK